MRLFNCCCVDQTKAKCQSFEPDASSHWKPMQSYEQWCDMSFLTDRKSKEMCCCSLAVLLESLVVGHCKMRHDWCLHDECFFIVSTLIGELRHLIYVWFKICFSRSDHKWTVPSTIVNMVVVVLVWARWTRSRVISPTLIWQQARCIRLC